MRGAFMILVFPIGSDHERDRAPVVTLTLIGLNAAAFAACWAIGPERAAAVCRRFGYLPDSADPLRLLTHLFLHGSALHLLGNMVFLWTFGADLEDVLGRSRFIGFYIAAGAIAALAHHLFVRLYAPDAAAEPAIGASGAISGLIGFHVLRFFRFRLRLYYLLFFVIFLRQGFGWVPSVVFVALWFAVQFAASLTSTKAGSVDVAYWAHAGGFLAGFALALATRQIRRGAAERWLALGRSRFRQGMWWQAIEAFQKLERVDPRSAIPAIEQARCWEVIGQRERARDLFREGIGRLLAQGDPAGACDAYLEFLSAFPDATAPVHDEAGLRALAAECERRGKADKAAPIYEALMDR
jgi:membrane associated rhomboid family serine protease